MARVSVFTLGCRLNQFESDSITGQLIDRGHKIVAFGAEADVAVINSCTVTARADRKSRQAVNRGLKSAQRVVVTGCYADNPERVLPTDPRLELVGNAWKAAIPMVVSGEVEFSEAGTPGPGTRPAPGEIQGHFPSPPAGLRSRGMLKIQDGCDHVCAYCIVSRVRGPSRSVPAKSVLEDVTALARQGFREIVLTGVNVGDYHDGTHDLSRLVGDLLELDGDFRLRLTSIEPDQLSTPLIALFEHPRLCPHLHLALQSGSDGVLKAMHRDYTRDDVRMQMGALRSIDPHFNITADIIVGFPGEREADFDESVAMVEEFNMGHVHVFPFSQRPGTVAAGRSFAHTQVPGPEIRRRAARLRRLARRSALSYREKLMGLSAELLVETISPDGGAREGYIDHYCRLRLPSTETARDGAQVAVEPGELVSVTVAGVASDGVLVGEAAEDR